MASTKRRHREKAAEFFGARARTLSTHEAHWIETADGDERVNPEIVALALLLCQAEGEAFLDGYLKGTSHERAECAALCDQERSICYRQKAQAPKHHRLLHEGGACIALTLAHRIRGRGTTEDLGR